MLLKVNLLSFAWPYLGLVWTSSLFRNGSGIPSGKALHLFHISVDRNRCLQTMQPVFRFLNIVCNSSSKRSSGSLYFFRLGIILLSLVASRFDNMDPAEVLWHFPGYSHVYIPLIAWCSYGL